MKTFRGFFFGAFFLISVGLFLESFRLQAPNVLRVDILDVGQGDAILLTSPSGVQMLIDAGRDRAVLRALGEVMSFSDRHIDVVVMTHPDADHIGGFPAVFDRYEIGAVVGTNSHSDTALFGRFQNGIDNEGSELFEARRGMVIDMGSGVFVQVLFPYADTIITGNDASVVAKVIYGKTSFLLTGDVGTSVEKHLVLREGDGLVSDVLKLGHHGSRTSTSRIFMESVQPNVAIISAGKDNSYGHPHKEVLDTLAGVGVPYLGTYEVGTVTFYSDGERVTTPIYE